MVNAFVIEQIQVSSH